MESAKKKIQTNGCPKIQNASKMDDPGLLEVFMKHTKSGKSMDVMMARKSLTRMGLAA
jgi:hypothetical protein